MEGGGVSLFFDIIFANILVYLPNDVRINTKPIFPDPVGPSSPPPLDTVAYPWCVYFTGFSLRVPGSRRWLNYSSTADYVNNIVTDLKRSVRSQRGQDLIYAGYPTGSEYDLSSFYLFISRTSRWIFPPRSLMYTVSERKHKFPNGEIYSRSRSF